MEKYSSAWAALPVAQESRNSGKKTDTDKKIKNRGVFKVLIFENATLDFFIF